MKKNSNEKAALGRLHAPKGNQPSCARCWLELPLGLRSTPPPSLSKEKEQKIYIDPFFFQGRRAPPLSEGHSEAPPRSAPFPAWPPVSAHWLARDVWRPLIRRNPRRRSHSQPIGSRERGREWRWTAVVDGRANEAKLGRSLPKYDVRFIPLVAI